MLVVLALAAFLLVPIAEASAAITAGTTSVAQGGNGTATNFNIAKPAGVVPGDFLLAIVSHSNQVDGTTNALGGGWTTLFENQMVYASPARYVYETVYYKFVQPGEPANYTVTITSGARAIATMSAFSGVDMTDPITLLDGMGHSTAFGMAALAPATTQVAAAPLQTAPNGDHMLVAVFCANGGQATVWGTVSDGMTSGVAHKWGQVAGPAIKTAYQDVLGGVNTGSRSVPMNYSGAQDAPPWVAHLIALNDVASTTPVTVGAVASDKVYDGTTNASVLLSSSDIAAGDDVTIDYTSATFDTKHSGFGKTVTVSGISLSGADAGKYVLGNTSATDSADISPAPLGIFASAASKVYDGGIYSWPDPSSGSLMPGDTFTELYQVSDSHMAGPVTLSVVCTINDGNGGENYDVSTFTAAGSITPMHITGAFVAPENKFYDGTADSDVVYSYPVGHIFDDDVSLTSGTASFADKHAGNDKIVTLTGATLSGTAAGNYVLDSVDPTTSDILPALLEIFAVTDTKEYDGNPFSDEVPSVSGLRGTDTINGLGQWFDSPAVGVRAINVHSFFVNDGNFGGNYILQVNPATGSITAKGLTITGALAQGKTYDGTTAAVVEFSGASLLGAVVNDDVDIDSTGYDADFEDRNVGDDKPVTVAGVALGGTDAGNYTITQPAGLVADIDPLHITGTFTAADKVEDGTTAATVLTRGLVGQLIGDTVSLAGGAATFSSANVGAWPVTLSGATLSGADAGNYYLDSVADTAATITSANQAPTAIYNDYYGLEDTPMNVDAPGVLGNDSDPDGDTLTALLLEAPAGTLNLAPDGGFTYTPPSGASGIDQFRYTASDGHGGSASTYVYIFLSPVNDEPSFEKGADQTVAEDSGAKSVPDWATSISQGPDPAQTLNFIVTNDNNALFSAQPAVAANGTLTYTPAANAFGSATVSVAIHDNGGTANGGDDTSPVQTFTITVTPVNDRPTITGGASQTVLEDSGLTFILGWANISVGPPNEAGQWIDGSTMYVSNPSLLLGVSPSVHTDNGSMYFTPVPNANGSCNVEFRVYDDGGTANGGQDTSLNHYFTITVTPVNDVPSFTAGDDQTVLEDAGAQTVTGWATDLLKGPANESAQTLNFEVTNDNNALFAAQPAIDAEGDLTYTPAANAFGSATVTVTLHDDGGTANGGDDTSDSQTFTITVLQGNEDPAANDDSAVVQEDDLVTVDVLANDSDSDGDPLTVTDATEPAHGSATVNANGTITYTPDANFNGADTFDYTISDGQGATDSATVSIAVNAVEDAPQIWITPASQSRQYSDTIGDIHAWATDIDLQSNGAVMTALSTEPYLDLEYDPDPIWDSLSIDEDYSGFTKHLWIRGRITEPEGVYPCTVTASDGTYSPYGTSRITVTPETASVDSLAAANARAGSTGVATVNLSGRISQDSDGSLGDLSRAVVHVRLTPIGGGAAVEKTITGAAIQDDGDFTAQMSNVPVAAYQSTCWIDGRYFSAPIRSGELVTVQSRTMGRTSGTGSFAWPGTRDRTSFEFSGRFGASWSEEMGGVVIARQSRSGTYVLDCDMISSLSLAPVTGASTGWAMLKGTARVSGPRVQPFSGRFTLYVEDRPTGSDRLWIQVYRNGSMFEPLSLRTPLADNMVPVTGRIAVTSR